MITVKIIIGANYGDEGKGLATHYFAEDAAKQGKKCLNVLYNGGCQRGHTVETQDKRHVFHHFGAGTFDGAVTYLDQDFLVNPMEYVREYLALWRVGVKPICHIHPLCRVTTPYDMVVNRIIEEYRENARHGSCGMGIWETVCRYDNTKNLLYWSDCVDACKSGRLKEYMCFLRKYALDRIKEYGITEIPRVYDQIINREALIENYIDDIIDMNNTSEIKELQEQKYDYIIFEGAQGLALDERNIEEYPHVTASKTGSEVPIERMKSLYQNDVVDIETVYVTRSYLTRHGAGYLPNECDKSDISPDIEDRTNRPNEYQGKLRYARLNGMKMIERIKADISQSKTSKNSLLVTHLNETSGKIYGRFNKDDAAIFDKIYLSGRKDGIDRCVYGGCINMI